MGAQAVRLTKIDIDNALSNAHLNIVYQPVVAFEGRRLLRYEAFVRWDHPGLGPLPPGAFLSFFESQGRTGDLTRYVVEKSIIAAYRADIPEDVGLSINLSTADLTDPALPKSITQILKKHEWAPHRLTLECPLFSPDVPIKDQSAAYEALARTGCPLSLEVRGRTTDAMRKLRPFPFAEIKTGGPAVLRQLRSNRGGPGLNALSELLTFARECEVPIVAVGVEDHEAASSLSSLGFDLGQGHVLGRAGALPGGAAKSEPVEITDRENSPAPLDLSTEESQSAAQGKARRARIAAAKRAAMRRLKSAVDQSTSATPFSRDAVETARSLQSRLESHFLPDAEPVQAPTDLPSAVAATPAKRAAIDEDSTVRRLIDELPAELRQAPSTTAQDPDAKSTRSIADTLEADCANPADLLDEVIDDLPTLPADELPTDESTKQDEPLVASATFQSDESAPRKVKRQWRITHFWPRSWRRWNRRRLARQAARLDAREAAFQRDLSALTETLADQPLDPSSSERRQKNPVSVMTEREQDPLVFGPLTDLR